MTTTALEALAASRNYTDNKFGAVLHLAPLATFIILLQYIIHLIKKKPNKF